MGTREEVSLRSLKDSKDSEVQAGAELGELGRRGRCQRRARPTCLDGKDGEDASYKDPQERTVPVGAWGTPRWGGLDLGRPGCGGVEKSCADRGSSRGVPIDTKLGSLLIESSRKG